jgi:threonine/homoserine/homoserine lactone efflux protein
MVIDFLLFGIIVGLAAGLSPGPLTTLVLSETLKNGKKEGIQVAVSPLISESPIILFVLVILSSVAENYIIIGAISMLGACFLVYLGLSNLTTNTEESKEDLRKDNALLRGITTNLLNPNAYMFWLTIGGPRIIESVQVHISATILFILGFYTMLVGSKIAIAIVVNKSRTLVRSKYYVYIIRALGIVLIAFALIFVRDALEYAGFSRSYVQLPNSSLLNFTS